MRKEIKILEKFIREQGLRHTPQRKEILRIFLSVEKPLSIDELYEVVKRKSPDTGYTTIYRTMKLLWECELAHKIDFGDGIARFEHKRGGARHHSYLVCLKCGSYMDVKKPEIEKLQDKLVKEYDKLVKERRFMPLRHKLPLLGICNKCSAS